MPTARRFVAGLALLLATRAFASGPALPPSPPAANDATQLADEAMAALRQGHHGRAAPLFRAASDRDPSDPQVAYNAACAAALSGDPDAAFALLVRASDAGFRDGQLLTSDTDLASLRADPRWPLLVAHLDGLRTREQRRQANPLWATPYRADLPIDDKVAGLSRLWAEVRDNFANFDLVPDLDWDALYFAALPRVRATTSTRSFYQELRALVAQLHDGHTGVTPPTELYDELLAGPLLRTRRVEGKVVLAEVADPELAVRGLVVGDEIVAIDGTPIERYADEQVAPYQAASTPQDLATRVYEYALLSGPLARPVALGLRHADGKERAISVPRVPFAARRQALARPPFAIRELADGIVVVTLTTFDDRRTADDYLAAWPTIAKARALVLDLRENGGGNSDVGFRILATLTAQPYATSRWHTRTLRPTLRAWGYGESVYGGGGTRQPAGGQHFAEPVALLTSARTYSAAEDFTVAFDVMNRGPIVGEATGGSTGQPLFIKLPGGGSARICTKRDTYPDGREFVGVGVQPDIPVAPTLDDLRGRRDPVLAVAIRELTQRLATAKHAASED
jgi:C-terminal processing protease CtpA/Prc